MRKNYLLLLLLFPLISIGQTPQWGVCPQGWRDFRFGLQSDNLDIQNTRMKNAISEGAMLDYRYVYINEGVDSLTNSLSWLFTQYENYTEGSTALGLKPGYVIYMLQEEGARSKLLSNAASATQMKKFFNSVKSVAQKSKGKNAIFVIEPDTWGYYLQFGLEQNLNIDPAKETARINDLGDGYEWLQGLPNNLCGVAQGIVKTIKAFAPDAQCGHLINFWGVNGNGATGTPVAEDDMVYWKEGDVKYAAQKTADFMNSLLGGPRDFRGDFIVVEKSGASAGFWKYKNNPSNSYFYWGDKENANYLLWCKTLAQAVNLPLLGWQISIGHMGLPNTVDRYEDTFMPYFFTHTKDFMDAGFVGILGGKGGQGGTDYSNASEGNAGDNGWFFEQMKTFDKGRPYTCRNSNVRKVENKNGIVFRITGNVLKQLTWTGTDAVIKEAQLYTIDGRLVNTFPASANSISINTAGLATGIYIVKTSIGSYKMAVTGY
jgi:hypothetical protein